MDIHEHSYASKGVANAALTTGIIGASGVGLSVLNALSALSGGGIGAPRNGGCYCNEDHLINRYEAGMSAKIAELETEIKLRDANAYTLGEINKFRNYVDAKFDAVNGQLCQQAVVNAQITANLSCLQNTVSTLSGLTKTIIPITNVCPEPMPQYNSWTAPTATT